MCCVLCWSAIPKHFRMASQKSQNQHQLISRPNLLFVETLRRTKFILILKHYGSLVFAVLSIAFCSSALCPDLPVSAYAAPWLNSFSGLQTDPQNLCAWALHIFFFIIHWFLQGNRSGVNIFHWRNHPSSFFLLPLPPFLVTGVFNNLHTMPLLAPSLAKCERNCLIDWRVPGEEISINHLIAT